MEHSTVRLTATHGTPLAEGKVRATVVATAHAIADGNLTMRVPPVPANTEVGSLSASLNTMLGHIQRAGAGREVSTAELGRSLDQPVDRTGQSPRLNDREPGGSTGPGQDQSGDQQPGIALAVPDFGS